MRCEGVRELVALVTSVKESAQCTEYIVRFAIFQLLYTAPKSSIWLQATSTHGAGLPYVPNETFPSRSLLYQKKLRPGYGLQQESAVSCALQLFALQKFSADLAQEEEGAIAVEEVEVSHE